VFTGKPTGHPPTGGWVRESVTISDKKIKSTQKKKPKADLYAQIGCEIWVFNKRFYNSNYQDLKTGESITGGIHNYFVAYSVLAPVTTVWSKIDNEFVLYCQQGNLVQYSDAQ
jgi:hypothetical protein